MSEPEVLSRAEFRIGCEQADEYDPPEVHRCLVTLAALARALRARKRLDRARDVHAQVGFAGTPEQRRAAQEELAAATEAHGDAYAQVEELGWLDADDHEGGEGGDDVS